LLLGAIFVFFGLNLFLHFLPMGPVPPGPAGQFFGALAVTHYIHVVAAIQVLTGLMLLIGIYIPLALTLLAPVIFNIFLVHLLMAPNGLPMAALVILLWILVAIRVRSAFYGLFQRRVED
jgi:hypothetical protein